jgi:prepilin-type processing-associated H-X9-DG protein
MCATDRKELARRRPAIPTTPATGMVARTARRDYSYAMNCCICHSTQMARFVEPGATMIYGEGALDANDYSGEIGPGRPGMVTRSISFRHNRKGHVAFGDLHIERLDKKQYDSRTRLVRFWYPTDDLADRRFMP